MTYFNAGSFYLVFVLGLLASGSCSKNFRFDYELNEQAKGWLKFHVVPATWEAARMRCHAEGAVLASPLSNQLKAAIVSFVKKQTGFVHEGGLSIFSGVHATFSQGDYSSVEGVPLPRLAVTWAPGEPDNYENSESCLLMNIHSNGSMADVRCDNVRPYVCDKKDTLLIKTECGTIDSAYVLEPRTGSCYKFHERGLIWSQAYMTCVAEGGHLVVINSDTEAQVVKDIYSRHPESSIHSTDPYVMGVGFRDMSVHNNFMTIHGQTLEEAGYARWSSGNPSNSTRDRIGDQGEFCGSILHDGLLNDVFCHAPIAFLCEKKPASLL